MVDSRNCWHTLTRDIEICEIKKKLLGIKNVSTHSAMMSSIHQIKARTASETAFTILIFNPLIFRQKDVFCQ